MLLNQFFCLKRIIKIFNEDFQKRRKREHFPGSSLIEVRAAEPLFTARTLPDLVRKIELTMRRACDQRGKGVKLLTVEESLF